MTASLGDQLRPAVRAHPAGSGGRRHRDGVAGVRLADRRLSSAGRPGAPVRQAVLLRDRSHHPQPHVSTTASTTRSSPRSWPPASPRPCCTAGRAPPAPKGATEWPGHEGHVVDVLRALRHPTAGGRVLPALEPCARPLPVPAPAGSGRASTSASCAPTTSPTTCPGSRSSTPDGRRVPDEDGVRARVDAEPAEPLVAGPRHAGRRMDVRVLRRIAADARRRVVRRRAGTTGRSRLPGADRLPERAGRRTLPRTCSTGHGRA